MSWSDHLVGRNTLFMDITKFFDHKFVGRVYDDDALFL